VQVSADGRAVVFHDWNLARLTGFDSLPAQITTGWRKWFGRRRLHRARPAFLRPQK
jgi:glycerophosphoryl diester phosphodiesterase